MSPHDEFDLFDQWAHGYTIPADPVVAEDEWWRETQPEGGFNYGGMGWSDDDASETS